jgi:cardiolipin synthase
MRARRSVFVVNLPTAITGARLVVAPAIARLVLDGKYMAALVVFALAAVSDLVDGALARRLHATSELGARLDPIADKALMLATAIPLAAANWLPVWLVGAILVRDVVIMSGAVAYRFFVGPLTVAPTLLSKLNTALELVVTTLALASAADVLPEPRWMTSAYLAVLATVLVSGGQYVWVFGGQALHAWRESPVWKGEA